MNLFALEGDPATGRIDWIASARAHDNLRVGKMALESCQILSAAARRHGCEAPYRSTHARHPSVLWAGDALQNYQAVLTLATALFLEWGDRFGRAPQEHGSWHALQACLDLVVGGELAERFPREEATPLPLAMPEEFHDPCPVTAYRRFWASKPRLRYPAGRVPAWLPALRQAPLDLVG